ncbi:hypothetical protein P7C71_g3814, partial [Lecanoromycetidae sp. Uapishka_2]
PSTPLRILDNACGPAVLTGVCLQSEAFSQHEEIHISAVDISEDFIKANQATIDATPAWSSGGRKVDTEVMNGMDLRFADETFDVQFTSLGIFAFRDPVKGAAELYRTLKPGGVAALTTWKSVGWYPLLHECEEIVKPGKEKTTFPFLEPWQVPGKLEKTLRDGGFEDVKESDVMVYAWFENDKAAAKNWTETLRLMVGKGWTDEEKGQMEDGFLKVIRGGSKCAVHGEGGKVGFEMVAFTAIARK